MNTPSADSILASGSVTAPASGAVIASVALPTSNPPSGITDSRRYKVIVSTGQTGTVDTAHESNLQLTHGATVVGSLLSSGAVNEVEIPRVSPGSDPDISVKASAAFGAGAIVAASLTVTRMG